MAAQSAIVAMRFVLNIAKELMLSRNKNKLAAGSLSFVG